MLGLVCCMGKYCVGSKLEQVLSLNVIRRLKGMIIEKYLDAMLRNGKCNDVNPSQNATLNPSKE